MAPILQVNGLTVKYNGAPALEDVSFSIEAGERMAIVGPNGSGKSTLFKALAGLVRPVAGSVQTNGAKIGYVPQRSEVDWRFPVTVHDVVMMGRIAQIGWLRWQRSGDREVVRRCLEQVGMTAFAGRQIGELSGGQQQRVFIARALAQNASILLMDEPFSGVDAATQEATLALLDDLQAQHVTALISTHDLNLAASRFEQVLLLNHHVVAYGRVAEVFTPQALGQAFSGQVLMLPNGLALVDECCPPDEARVI